MARTIVANSEDVYGRLAKDGACASAEGRGWAAGNI
jgi:hypothetical protein